MAWSRKHAISRTAHCAQMICGIFREQSKVIGHCKLQFKNIMGLKEEDNILNKIRYIFLKAQVQLVINQLQVMVWDWTGGKS